MQAGTITLSVGRSISTPLSATSIRMRSPSIMERLANLFESELVIDRALCCVGSKLTARDSHCL